MKFPKRLFYGQNIVPDKHKLGYVWIGRTLRGATKIVKWNRPTEQGYLEKEYKYKYGRKYQSGGFSWADFVIRKFAKVDRSGKIMYRNGDMVRNYNLDIQRYVRGKKAGLPKIDKHGNYIPVNPKDYARVEKEMFVEVTPNWQAALVNIRREYVYNRWTNENHRTRRTVEKDYYPSRKRNKFYLSKVFAKRQFELCVRVGFLHPDRTHGSWGGHKTHITYRSLIAALMFRGYDPLMPLRDMAYINKIRRNMGRECGEALNNGKPFEPILKKYGREMENYVYEYIVGGIKPPLASSTIASRKSRQKSGFAKYPQGIEEPLVETGELANEISYEVKQSDLQQKDIEQYEETAELNKTPVIKTEKESIEDLAKNYEEEADARARLIAKQQARAMDDFIEDFIEKQELDKLL